MLFSELKKKEVINLKNCERLGKVTDFEFDECTGQIFKLIIPGDNKWCGFVCKTYAHFTNSGKILQIKSKFIYVNFPNN